MLVSGVEMKRVRFECSVEGLFVDRAKGIAMRGKDRGGRQQLMGDIDLMGLWREMEF